MTVFSTYFRDGILAYIKGTALPTPPANLYVATFSVAPARAGTGGTENTTSIRTAGRVAIASSGWDAIAASGNSRQIQNTSAVSFGNAVNSVSVVYIGLFDAASGGNFIAGVASPFTSTAGAPVTIPAGALIIGLT